MCDLKIKETNQYLDKYEKYKVELKVNILGLYIINLLIFEILLALFS